jgi:hypothetical protein
MSYGEEDTCHMRRRIHVLDIQQASIHTLAFALGRANAHVPTRKRKFCVCKFCVFLNFSKKTVAAVM